MTEEISEQHKGLLTRVLEPGDVIASRYRIVRMIGRGGMATVYLAQDAQRAGQAVALKIMHREFSRDKVCLERFFREITLLSRLNHPNIVTFYEAGRDEELVYFAMEAVQGEPLQQIIDRRSFSGPEIAKIILGICDGLSAIHELGIIHRDIKPENIMLTPEGVIKITDFGVAREKASKLTTKIQKVGSMNYMAPEIWLGKELGKEIDFYALGVVLYELATKVMPFEGETITEVMDKHLYEAVKPPKDLNASIPEWLNALTLKLLEKNPKHRPQSTNEIIDYVTENASDDLLNGKCAKGEYHLQGKATADGVSPKVATLITEGKKTYIFKVTATRTDYPEVVREKRHRPKMTVVIPLPKKAAFVFEVESPSRDFLLFGLFLASLQMFDWYLTAQGIDRFSIHAEGNPILRNLMHRIGPESALFIVKATAIGVVAVLTLIARRIHWIKNVMAVLCGIYLIAAILPWLYILNMSY